MDRVEFAVIEVPERDDTSPAIAVRINGRPLEDLWAETGALPTEPIWIHEGSALCRVPPGTWTVPVVTCTCGFFDCGGGTVRIDIDDETVRWSEFDRVLGKGRVPIGPFTFARHAYDAAIGVLALDVRAALDG